MQTVKGLLLIHLAILKILIGSAFAGGLEEKQWNANRERKTFEKARIEDAIATLKQEVSLGLLDPENASNSCQNRFAASANIRFQDGWGWLFSNQMPFRIIVIDRPLEVSSSINAISQAAEPFSYVFIFNDYIRSHPIGCQLPSLILHEVIHLARKDTGDFEDTTFQEDCKIGCLNPGVPR